MSYNKQDIEYMQRAISLAKNGAGFVNPNPMVGCVIVKDGDIIGEGFHEYYGGLHAERNAIKNCKSNCNGATLYVTLEPCSMCAGALIQSRIKKIYIGAMDAKSGACGSVLNLLTDYKFNHNVEIEYDVLQNDCEKLLKEFFKELREYKKLNRKGI